MSVGFTFNDSSGYTSDIDNYLVRREYFSRGGLWTWGRNTEGELGDNTITDRSSPGSIIDGGSFSTWREIGIGWYHTAAIKTDGTLWTWGMNSFGQLGDNTVVTKSSPVQVTGGGNIWIQVSGGSYHTTAIKTDGTLWSWGRNNYGQLGLNFIGVGNSSPIQVSGGGNTWYQVVGSNHTTAIKTDGTLWSWGLNSFGQLGINSTANTSTPVQVIGGGTNWKQVTGGQFHTAAIKTDGTLWTWGRNTEGELGDNTIVHKSTPVQVSGGGTNWKQVTGGQFHTAAIKTDGTLWTWGFNGQGQLGLNDMTNTSSPVQISGGGTNWKQVSGGSNHTAAIKTDGTLWTWGLNSTGQLGLNTISSYSSPVPTIEGFNNWKSISMGWAHSAGIVDDSL